MAGTAIPRDTGTMAATLKYSYSTLCYCGIQETPGAPEDTRGTKRDTRGIGGNSGRARMETERTGGGSGGGRAGRKANAYAGGSP